MMPRTRVKFCGVMRPEDATAAAAAGADAVGMVLHADARRRIDTPAARRVVAALPPYVTAVGLFVDAPAATIARAVRDIGLQAVQLHGRETPADVAACGRVPVIKAVPADDGLETTLAAWRQSAARGETPNLVGLLIDSPGSGGTGHANDFGRLRSLIDAGAFAGLPPLILAGGLRPENVAVAIRTVRPYGVDTSSGIEAAYGVKSAEKMRTFVAAVASV